jgi:phosphatidylglycerophosphatase A
MLTPLTFAVVLAVSFGIGVWACAVAGRGLGHADHPSLVWDEIVAFLAVLYFTPRHGYWPLVAFVLFRLFDIAKPPPIRYYERNVKGGLGAMIDDLIAAFYALLVLALARLVTGW